MAKWQSRLYQRDRSLLFDSGSGRSLAHPFSLGTISQPRVVLKLAKSYRNSCTCEISTTNDLMVPVTR